MKKLRCFTLEVLLVSAIILCAGSLFCPAEGADEIRIGATAALTGPAAEAGVALKQGMILAVEEWNAKGGIFIKDVGKKIPLKLTVEDCQSKPEIGVSAGEKLITKDKVHVLVGDTLHSSVTMAVMELAPKYGIPVLSAEPVSTEIAKKVRSNPTKYWSFWKCGFNSEALGEGVFYTYKHLLDNNLFKAKNKSVAFIVEDTDWGRSNAASASELFKSIGWKTLSIETVALGYTDFYPQLTKIKAMDADILVTSFTAVSSGVASAKQFHELGLRSGHIGIYHPSRPEFVRQAGKAAEYMLWTTSYFDPNNISDHKAFNKKMMERWKTEANLDSAWGHDVINNVTWSIEKASSVEPKDIVGALAKLDRKGIIGRFVFNQEDHAALSGEDYLPVPGVQIQDGKYFVIYPSSLAFGSYKTPPWVR
jgi:branched-chain amino acid transport system substrate-binding protein